MTEAHDRATGCLLGLACGDALGRPVEFTSAAAIDRQHGQVTEMLANGAHGQPAGTVTDDTELALCIAESLAARERFDSEDIAERFVGWLDSGPFDVGLMTHDAIRRLRDGASPDEAGQQVWESRGEGSNAGNGSVMRCAPYAIALDDDPKKLIGVSRASSAITHADPRCTCGCAVLTLTLAGLLRQEAAPLSTALEHVGDVPDELLAALQPVEAAVDRQVPLASVESELESSGYVVDTLQTALYDGLLADTAEAAIVRAVNRGGDADTVGAVAGAVAGARFGAGALPDRWVRSVREAERLRELAAELQSSRFGSGGVDA